MVIYQKVDKATLQAGDFYWLEVENKHSILKILVKVLCKGSRYWEVTPVAGDGMIVTLYDGVEVYRQILK